MSGLRRGKWTPEEESYVNAVIYHFNQGTLPVPAGTTLRSYLSEKLNCDPMRITKKFTGEEAIGKRVFKPERVGVRTQQELRDINEALLALEIKWKRKMASMKRESERKAHRAVVLPPNIPPNLASSSRSAVDMAKTASWLNRANQMLVATTHVSIDGDILSLAETRGLLNEGATLKRSRKELLELGNVSPSLKSRRSNSPDPSTANDAMALFGFMQSVAGGAGPSEPQSKAPVSTTTSASTSTESLTEVSSKKAAEEHAAKHNTGPTIPTENGNAAPWGGTTRES
ncbi:hypothetical protein TrCOL_g3270 [Triparma columacea]|uniref:Uncharacterized protein n=1 Tax=Triparma columacea TaxID=722753 RepID=A0A9W7G4E0_9STRA|nr:hypothetical protein TrCOL_g3270 [Triparma columacea]